VDPGEPRYWWVLFAPTRPPGDPPILDRFSRARRASVWPKWSDRRACFSRPRDCFRLTFRAHQNPFFASQPMDGRLRTFGAGLPEHICCPLPRVSGFKDYIAFKKSISRCSASLLRVRQSTLSFLLCSQGRRAPGGEWRSGGTHGLGGPLQAIPKAKPERGSATGAPVGLLRTNLLSTGGCTFVTASLDPGKAKEEAENVDDGPSPSPWPYRAPEPGFDHHILYTHAVTRDRLGRGSLLLQPLPKESRVLDRRILSLPPSLFRK
jgi:hypothetical protein